MAHVIWVHEVQIVEEPREEPGFAACPQFSPHLSCPSKPGFLGRKNVLDLRIPHTSNQTIPLLAFINHAPQDG